jgi:hypothetical protein
MKYIKFSMIMDLRHTHITLILIFLFQTHYNNGEKNFRLYLTLACEKT